MSDVTETLTPVEEPLPAPPSAGPGVAGARPAALVFLVTIAVPFLAYLAGVRAPATENRTPTPPPALSGVASLDDAALAQLTDHLAEVLPGRQVAIRADAWADLNLFGTSPNDAVLLGQDGWLFLDVAVTAPCRTEAQVSALRGELARAEAVVEATGRRLITTIAPDKATVYPELLGTSLPQDTLCGQEFGRDLAATVEADPPPGYVPFWQRIFALRDRAEEPIYFPADTHWTTDASLEMVRAIVETLDEDAWEDVTLTRREPTTFTGDLTLLLGLHRTQSERPLVVDRPGVTWQLARADSLPEVPSAVPDIDVSVFTGSGDDLIPGRVVMLHDSFAYMTRPQLAPFFQHLMMVRKHPVTVPWVAELLRPAETLVVEVVEREAWNRIVEDHLAASLAAALRDDLPHVPVELRPGDDGWATVDLSAGDVLVVPGAGREGDPFQLQVRGLIGGAQVLASQRDVRAGADLVFDLAELDGPTGVAEVRLLDGERHVVRPVDGVIVRLP